MAQRKSLTQHQIEVLRWIGDGCPDGVMLDGRHPERITAGALRNRGFVTTKGSGASWFAAITKTGQEYLARVDGPNPPVPREPNGSAARRLVDELQDAGGTLRVAAREYGQPRGPDYERRAANAERRGDLPPGKRLRLTRERGELIIELLDLPPGAPTALHPVPVPEAVRRYHPVVARLREDRERAEVTSTSLSRASRLLHALATAAESHGYEVTSPQPVSMRRQGDVLWSGERDGHLVISVNQVAVGIRIREDGVPGRAIHAAYSGSGTFTRTHGGGGEGPNGRLRMTIASPYSRSNRQSSWGDGARQRLEDLLPRVLHEVEHRAAEQRELKVLAEEAAERRRLEWEEAMERARVLFVEDARRRTLEDQVLRWERARQIRAFCDHVQSERSTDDAALEWIAWARDAADDLDPARGPLHLVCPTEISPADLAPFSGRWNPYGPDLDRSSRH